MEPPPHQANRSSGVRLDWSVSDRLLAKGGQSRALMDKRPPPTVSFATLGTLYSDRLPRQRRATTKLSDLSSIALDPGPTTCSTATHPCLSNEPHRGMARR